MIFSIGFFGKRNTQNGKGNKDHFINPNKSIWTCQHDWVVNFDFVILIGRMIDKTTNYYGPFDWVILYLN
jgi:hypothetical protein